MRRVAASPNHPSLHRIAAQRTLHLIDVDNLLGDQSCTEDHRIRTMFETYRQVSSFTEGDQVVVATGCNARHVLAVEAAWPSVCHRWRAGQDGADMALLEESDWAASTGRFARVVIGSGDRIFLAAMDRLRAADITVDFVSLRRTLARAIATRAHGNVRFLPKAV